VGWPDNYTDPLELRLHFVADRRGEDFFIRRSRTRLLLIVLKATHQTEEQKCYPEVVRRLSSSLLSWVTPGLVSPGGFRTLLHSCLRRATLLQRGCGKRAPGLFQVRRIIRAAPELLVRLQGDTHRRQARTDSCARNAITLERSRHTPCHLTSGANAGGGLKGKCSLQGDIPVARRR
jgi:hypothetical protein